MNEQVPSWSGWVVALAVLLQAQFAHHLGWAGEWCDLALAVALLCALACGVETGLRCGLVAGLLMGYATGLALPAFVLSRTLAGGLVGRLRFVVHGGNLLAQVGLVTTGVVVAELLFVLAYPAVLAQPQWLPRIFFRAGLTAIITPFVAWLLSWLPLPEERMV